MARKSRTVIVGDVTVAPELNPRNPDTKYTGGEPVFYEQPTPESRTGALMKSLNWYSRFFDRKTSKELILEFATVRGVTSSDIKALRSVHEREYNISLGWLARLGMRGLVHTDIELARIGDHLKSLLAIAHATKTEVVEEEQPKSNRPNVQEIMKEKAREAAGEIEGMFDDYILAGAKSSYNFKPIDILAKYNILPQHINLFTEAWKRKRDEIEEVIAGKDKQLVEGYNHYNKTQLKNLLKFTDQFLSDFNSYVSVKKASKAPRKRKAVPVEKQVAKLKYLKSFKDSATKLDLVSLHPVKLHGASEAFLFDSKKRKLIYLCADEYSKSFTVKGTTILGFDSGKSQVKTIRKPEEQLKEFLKLGKPSGRKFFADIKAVAISFNGRTNENMLILKAW
jgi:hypothetical protein